VPKRYREMMALAAAAAMKCPYCQTFHREGAKMYSASEEELNELAAIVAQTSFWSAVLHTQNYDMNKFGQEPHCGIIIAIIASDSKLFYILNRVDYCIMHLIHFLLLYLRVKWIESKKTSNIIIHLYPSQGNLSSKYLDHWDLVL
jgi:AhpD family alkylhydroperoxidase